MLNEEECKLAEDNHNLIYEYAHRKGLDLEEWYGELAIVLCECTTKWDPSRGKLSTLFNIMADNVMKNEWKKDGRQKRNSNGEVLSLDEMVELIPSHNINDVEYECDWENHLEREVVKMTLAGYTQAEIGDAIGNTQPYISRILKRFKERVG